MKLLKRKNFSEIALLAIFLVFLSGDAYAFNCDKARNYSEISICADQFLLRLDAAMNENYSFMLNSNIGDGARSDLISTQRKWFYQRNICKNKTCILDAYKTRLGEVCEYPVLEGIHPICTDYDEIVKQSETNFKGK